MVVIGSSAARAGRISSRRAGRTVLLFVFIALVALIVLVFLSKEDTGQSMEVVPVPNESPRITSKDLALVSVADEESIRGRAQDNLDGVAPSVSDVPLEVPVYNGQSLSDEAIGNVAERVNAAQLFLDMARGQAPLLEGVTREGAAEKAAHLAILVEFDCTHRSKYYSLPGETMEATVTRVMADGGHAWTDTSDGSHKIISGGATYEVPIGEYPIYDMLYYHNRSADAHLSPLDVPVDELISMVALATAYSEEVLVK